MSVQLGGASPFSRGDPLNRGATARQRRLDVQHGRFDLRVAGLVIPGDQLSIISYGKDRPVCQEHDETCWQKNRRIHIVAMTASR